METIEIFAPGTDEPVLLETVTIEVPTQPQRLVDQLNSFFQDNLSDEAQADLAPLKAAVKLELDQGRENIARLIIERATIPAELEPLRAQILELFDA